jgi:flavin-dependent dehydrogenase
MAEGNVAHFFEKFLRTAAKYIATPLEKIEVSVKPIAQGFAGKTYANRVIAVGEAAGHIKTTTGGGIYYGLLCADLAAEIIRNALLSDRYDERFLSQYEEKWKKEIDQELKLGYVFRKAFGKLSDRQIEGLFSLARTNGILPLVRTTARFDWHAELLCSLARYATIQKIFGMDLSKIY